MRKLGNLGGTKWGKASKLKNIVGPKSSSEKRGRFRIGGRGKELGPTIADGQVRTGDMYKYPGEGIGVRGRPLRRLENNR